VLRLVRPWADAVWEVGIAFGTVGARKGPYVLEITTYRAEAYDPDSRKPAVTYGDSLDEDLLRRDFTVNAMAVEMPGTAFVDPYDGTARPGRRRAAHARHPEDSFSDDPLRMMRAARFAAQLEFTVAPEVVAAMTAMSTGWRSCRPSGSATSWSSCCSPRARAPGSRCSSTPGWPVSCCRSCLGCASRSTSTTGTRTSTSTR
jgi:tRNA nucleotidyltransferase/poly(A) polymerase